MRDRGIEISTYRRSDSVNRSMDRDYGLYSFTYNVRRYQYGETELDAAVIAPNKHSLLKTYVHNALNGTYDRIVDIVDHHLK